MKNILLILFLLLLGPCLIAQEYITINDKPYRIDTLIYKHRVGPGTEYVYVDLPEFPLKIHVLEIDLKNPNVMLETCLGRRQCCGNRTPYRYGFT
ncbi:hypothetical protein NXV73_07060 [Bacteroides salyersiae]|nr:hypothetical protein [Bacteroides salyersiae]